MIVSEGTHARRAERVALKLVRLTRYCTRCMQLIVEMQCAARGGMRYAVECAAHLQTSAKHDFCIDEGLAMLGSLRECAQSMQRAKLRSRARLRGTVPVGTRGTLKKRKTCICAQPSTFCFWVQKILERLTNVPSRLSSRKFHD
jgi:hypothetical protein